MHGRWEGEERKRRNRHMWTGPTRGNNPSVSSVAGDVVVPSPSNSSPSLSGQVNFFYKDGRKISVGDCALFKPPQDSPPFVGLIRSLTGKEDTLKLGVYWLYRPAEVKLGKGILLEAAPNEIFFSFHKDETLAASLLHPCKVAFLPKGVELPSGVCSFVCRRVYDIENSCLWWLTDQDYINERQEEIDQLLDKTRIEMHATVQPGGRSPKPINGPTSQLKPGSDSVQNSASSFPSQVEGKKRERGEQGFEPIKRERYTKIDDGESGHSKSESMWKSEIAKFTERGGLVDSEGVEKLVHLMLPDRNEKKIDLVGRSVLAGVVAATDKFDCLNRFVQLRGLPVFDEWLQEVHKGKVGDGGSPKDNDKSVEEFLLVLLRALDKLPVNLHALQMCNIGKSVNHLRQHKNLEIQKKARSLVDTWKKRVEAEMDAKSGSNQAVPWQARSRLPEVSHGGNRHVGVSSDVAMKSSVVQVSASKAVPAKHVQGESTTKSATASPGSVKSAPSAAPAGNSLKEGQPRNVASGVSDLPMTAARDEKSSSSSQSHNNSQSCSSDHAKTVGLSGKEDARSSTAGSVAANKIIGGSSRHRKSANGFPGSSLSGVQRETGSSRGSLHRNSGSEKLLQATLTGEKTGDAPMAEGNSPKLVVKISNRGRSPAQSASGGSIEDLSVINSRASSPVLSEKHDQFDRNLKDKNDAYRTNITSDVNTESWQSNDFKEVLTGSDEGDGSPATIPEEEHCRTGEDTMKVAEVSKATSSSSGDEHKAAKLYETSFNPMNALIESCVKDSEANASMSAGDDVGINLLASVAAGEMSKSDMISPVDSPPRSTPVVDNSFVCSDSRIKSPPGHDLGRERSQSAEDEHEKRIVIAVTALGKNSEAKNALISQNKSTGEFNGFSNFSSPHVAEQCLEANAKSEDTVAATLVAASTSEKISNGGEEKGSGTLNADVLSEAKEKLQDSAVVEDKVNIAGAEVENKVVEGTLLYPSSETDGENKKKKNEDEAITVPAEQKTQELMNSECAKGTNGDMLQASGSGRDVGSEGCDELKAEKSDETDGRGHSTGKQKTGRESNTGSAVTDQKVEGMDESVEGNQINEQRNGGIATLKPSSEVQETEQQVKSKASKYTGVETDDAEDCTSTAVEAASLSAAAGVDVEAKVAFDLNEGFNGDDGKYSEPTNSKPPASSSAVQLISPFLLPVSSVSSGLPASITVAAAAKGPFVPPEDLLKNRGELGWKGSAATSAFRPAEPRKVMETPVCSASTSPPDASTAKPSRPPLDIDLNVPDERILEDFASRSSVQASGSISDVANNHDEAMASSSIRGSGGLDLDLNRVDEPVDMGSHLTSNGLRMDAQLQPVKSSVGLLNGEVSNRRDFDLNDGPLVEEASAEPSPFGHHPRNSLPSQPSISGLRINNPEISSFPSWFPQGTSYPAVTIQSIMPDRAEQPFPIVAPGGPPRMLTPPTASNPFGPDVYRGPVLSSSPAVPFPSTPFQYSVFPFGTNFPLPSASFSGSSTTYVDSSSGGRLCFPAVHSQVLTPTGVAVPSHYPRPYVVSLPDGSSSGGAESSRKWGRQSLDLNAGPLGPDIEGRDETSSLMSRQLSVASSPALADEQSRMYQVAGGGVLKRKEPEGGWEVLTDGVG
ncbi:hypothetical protein Tsubulata_042413 [Turnera subulata]|uniref:BAH domain-containing protein n=1 Tax=Turnera subulata TaxID=218843 RepID=A0A9Q0F9M4_9ROSI|nr:hypothetical protein Tsubulata_042413 [Turnera subulata]